MTKALVFAIIIKLLISGVILYSTWIRKNKLNVFAKVLSSMYILSFWLGYLISNKLILVYAMLITVVTIVYLCYVYLSKRIFFKILFVELVYILYFLLISTNDYIIAQTSQVNIFLLASLPICLVSIVVVSIVAVKNKLFLNEKYRVIAIVSLVLCVGIGSLCVSWSALENLNYVLDTSEGTRKTAIVEEKDIDHTGKGGMHYNLILKIDGRELEYEVSESVWESCDIGESYPLICHKGAFGVEYYISESIE